MSTKRSDELDSFESALLTELKEVVAERASSPAALTSSGYAAQPATRHRPVRWVAASAAAFGAAALGVATLGGTPAYAVSTGDDGSVTVTINRLEGADALEAELERNGINADVTYTPAGKMCAAGRYTQAPPTATGGITTAETTSDGVTRFTFPKGMVKAGQTLVLESMWPDEHTWAVKQGVAQGEVADCQLVDWQAPAGAETQVDGEGSGAGGPVTDGEPAQGVATHQG